MPKYHEPHSEERSKAARAKAERVFNANYGDSMEEALLFLRFVISRHYSIPIFSDYFTDRSLDDLIFESELIRLQTVPIEVQKSEVVKSNKEEAESIFPDEWEDVEPPANGGDQVFNDLATEFMQKNEFKE